MRNVSHHPANRTVMYKSELTVKSEAFFSDILRSTSAGNASTTWASFESVDSHLTGVMGATPTVGSFPDSGVWSGCCHPVLQSGLMDAFHGECRHV